MGRVEPRAGEGRLFRALCALPARCGVFGTYLLRRHLHLGQEPGGSDQPVQNPLNIHGPRQDSRELHRLWAAGGGSHCKSSWNDRRAGDRNDDDIYILSKIVVVNTQLSYLTLRAQAALNPHWPLNPKP